MTLGINEAPPILDRVEEYRALTCSVSDRIAQGEHLPLPNGWQVGIEDTPEQYFTNRRFTHAFRWGILLVAPPGHQTHNHDAGHVWNYEELLRLPDFAELASDASLAACEEDTEEAYEIFAGNMDQMSDILGDVQDGRLQDASTVRTALSAARMRFANLVDLSNKRHPERVENPREELFVSMLGAMGLSQEQISFYYASTSPDLPQY